MSPTAMRAILNLNGWELVEGREAIAKTFEFADFNQAFGFEPRGPEG